ncbi:hypothetical protein ZOSMA_21G00750 [Zostera marina]|uniref:Uncharacterized protein n=1 Tax=Zostera marina TaxID=29655 RepID=A0A0K9PJT6_ZOSMR|nr:hypothetical protein ZOSMA_21G00750 [Zostera marina]
MNSSSVNKSLNSIQSTHILQQIAITPIDSKNCLDGSSSMETPSYPSVDDNCNSFLLSYPTVIHNSPEFCDSVIRNAEEVEARIRNTKNHTYEYLSVVARCINFSPRITCSKPPPFIKSPYEDQGKGKENIEPDSVGPFKSNETKHLMLRKS